MRSKRYFEKNLLPIFKTAGSVINSVNNKFEKPAYRVLFCGLWQMESTLCNFAYTRKVITFFHTLYLRLCGVQRLTPRMMVKQTQHRLSVIVGYYD